MNYSVPLLTNFVNTKQTENKLLNQVRSYKCNNINTYIQINLTSREYLTKI